MKRGLLNYKSPGFGGAGYQASSEDEEFRAQNDDQIKKKILKKHYDDILKKNKVWTWISDQSFEKQRLLSTLYFKGFITMQSAQSQETQPKDRRQFGTKEREGLDSHMYKRFQEFCDEYHSRIDIMINTQEARNLMNNKRENKSSPAST